MMPDEHPIPRRVMRLDQHPPIVAEKVGHHPPWPIIGRTRLRGWPTQAASRWSSVLRRAKIRILPQRAFVVGLTNFRRAFLTRRTIQSRAGRALIVQRAEFILEWRTIAARSARDPVFSESRGTRPIAAFEQPAARPDQAAMHLGRQRSLPAGDHPALDLGLVQ